MAMGKGACLLLVFVGLQSTYADISFQYQYISELRTWAEAQEYCRAVHTDLATVDNVKNMTTLLKTVNSQGKMWIGLERIMASSQAFSSPESWGWSDKSQTSFRYWIPGKPDNYGSGENCTAIDMSHQGHWDDLSCNLKLPFICQGALQKKFVQVKFMLDEKLPLNDFSETFLDQIKSKLIVSGLPLNMRLQWRNQRDGKVLKAWPNHKV